MNAIFRFFNRSLGLTRIAIESGVGLLILSALYVVFTYLDAFERLTTFLNYHEIYQLDELVLTLLCAPVLLVFLAYRRCIEHRRFYEKERLYQHQLQYQQHIDPDTQLPRGEHLKQLIKDYCSLSLGQEFWLVNVAIEVQNLDLLLDETLKKPANKKNVLLTITDILQEAAPNHSIVGRLSSDVFVVVFSAVSVKNGEQQLFQLQEKALPPRFNDEVSLAFNCGAVITQECQHPYSSYNPLMYQAICAIHMVTSRRVGQVKLYDPEQVKRDLFEQERRLEIKQGIALSQFCLYFQPQIEAKTQVLAGVEALIRWQHPSEGLLSPQAFLPLIQETFLALEIGEWVIEQALMLLSTSDSAWSLSINLFPYHLQHPAFFSRFIALIERYPKADLTRLKIEITEQGQRDDQAIKQNIIQCLTLGVRFSLDDFGTGHSTLDQLRVLPVSEIKIDRCFIENFLTNLNDYKMVLSLFQLAKSFNLSLVAEGVETEKQASCLCNMGCHLLQGYLYAKPMQLNEFLIWEKSH